jgi:hypothetical protein
MQLMGKDRNFQAKIGTWKGSRKRREQKKRERELRRENRE